MEALKPCPFCGGEADFHEHERVGVECIECGAGFACVYRDRDEAAEEWNRRAERTCRVGCYPPGYEDNLHYEVCSECGTILTASRPGDRHAARASYCPNCGARVIDE